MVATKFYKSHVVQVDGVDIDSIQNLSFGANTDVFKDVLTGEVEPRFVSTNSHNPTITIDTLNIKAILDLAGLNGKEITGGNFTTFLKRLAGGGVILAGSSHLKLTVNEGILIPRTITAAQNGQATASYECAPRFDGTNDPVEFSDGQVLAGAINDNQIWTVGKATVNGIPIQITEINVDFGFDLILEGSDGDPFASFVSINFRQPTVSIKTADASLAAQIKAKGQRITSGVIFYLRKMAQGAQRDSDISTTHIKFTIAEGSMLFNTLDASGNEISNSEIMVHPVFDGTNSIMEIDTAAAIT